MVIFVPKKCSNLVGNSSSDRDFKLTFETQVILLWQKPVRQQPRRKSGKADNIEVPSTVVGLVAMQMANSLQCNCTLGKVKCHKNSHFQNGRKHWCRVLFSRRFVTFHQACSKKMNIYVHNIAKFLTFPPKWISFLQVLPLILFVRCKLPSDRPPHQVSVLSCYHCPKPLRLCWGHQKLLARAGNSKFHRVVQQNVAKSYTSIWISKWRRVFPSLVLPCIVEKGTNVIWSQPFQCYIFIITTHGRNLITDDLSVGAAAGPIPLNRSTMLSPGPMFEILSDDRREEIVRKSCCHCWKLR